MRVGHCCCPQASQAFMVLIAHDPFRFAVKIGMLASACAAWWTAMARQEWLWRAGVVPRLCAKGTLSGLRHYLRAMVTRMPILRCCARAAHGRRLHGHVTPRGQPRPSARPQGRRPKRASPHPPLRTAEAGSALKAKPPTSVTGGLELGDGKYQPVHPWMCL